MPSDNPAVNEPTRPEFVDPVALGALGDLVGGTVEGDAGTQVSGLTHSSGAVRPGDLYAAVPGSRTHGARFVPEAVGSGAAAVLTDADGAVLAGDLDVPVLLVESPGRCWAPRRRPCTVTRPSASPSSP